MFTYFVGGGKCDWCSTFFLTICIPPHTDIPTSQHALTLSGSIARALSLSLVLAKAHNWPRTSAVASLLLDSFRAVAEMIPAPTSMIWYCHTHWPSITKDNQTKMKSGYVSCAVHERRVNSVSLICTNTDELLCYSTEVTSMLLFYSMEFTSMLFAVSRHG